MLNKLSMCCLSIWLVIGSIAGLLLGQHQASVLHPVVLPLIVLIILAFALVILACVVGIARLIEGNHRRSTVIWLALAAVPVGLFASSLVYAQQQWAQRLVPVGIRGNLAAMFGGSLMEAQALYLFPERLESGRLVMFYYDLKDADGDIESMDRHVADLERLLGRPLRSKIHWVRGSLLGQGSLSFLGLALGSTQSPANSLDRHELAHAVLTQVRVPSADPPMMLHEGWAETQSGMDSATLADRALEAYKQDQTAKLADLLSSDNYRLDAGRAYSYGGGFVDFLLREFSVAQFVDIYNQWQVSSSDEDFRSIYGMNASELEDAFWRDAAAIAHERR